MNNNDATTEDRETILNRMVDFFWIYYGAAISKQVRKDPALAITLLHDDIKAGISSTGKLSIYAAALRDSVAYHGLSQHSDKSSRKDIVRASYD
jgi:hypothetical protein